ncbi:MAG: MBL fold metallo-hydrolase [Eubacteriales bacterium]
MSRENVKVTDMRIHPGDSGFLIDDGKTAILIDSGYGFTGLCMAQKIKDYLGERPLDFIFLTHSHYDHALGSAYILETYPNATVVAGTYAASIFRRAGALRKMEELDRSIAAISGTTDYPFLGDKLRVDIEVNDGDVIKAGDLTFAVMDLPGHTKCSVGFYCPEEAMLIATETLGIYDGGEVILPSFLVSFENTLASIDRALALKIDRLLIPHLGDLEEERTRFYLDNIRRRSVESAEEYAAALREGKSTEEIATDYIKRYRKGYVEKIYPPEAMMLNTTLMIDRIGTEFGIK